MKHKLITLTNGKEIHLYDDLFTYWQRDIWYQILLNSSYAIAASDHHDLEHQSDWNLGRQWSMEELGQFGILSHPALTPHMDFFEGYNIIQARANLTTVGDSNRFHTDMVFPKTWQLKESYRIPRDNHHKIKTLLYYVNLKWDLYWGGYTLFANDALDDIEKCLMYVPGRVVMFDSTIPHCVAAPWVGCPTVRFTFAVQWKQYAHEHSTEKDGPLMTPFGEYK
tara:strand:+ start:1898 stop:2566 length:669 start_codon:yes stop_codon:yes gene_type:complete